MRRPALRYHGGKWRLASWVMSHFPPHRVYTEVYGGAMSVLLRKPRVYAEVYNDLDEEVVNVFRVLRDPGTADALRRLLELTPFARLEFLASYEDCQDPVERARRAIIRSFMGFGSNSTHTCGPRGMRTRASTWTSPTGFRSNSNRSGTTPAHDWMHWPDEVPAFVERLRGVVIECRDAIDVLCTHDAQDALHYVDPPYVAVTRAGGKKMRQEYRHETTDDDHRRLAAVLRGLRGYVVLSGYRSDLYAELYPDWPSVERHALADGAQKRTEVLWLSPRTDEALRAGQLELYR